jgi:excisionase family DNA binding protein
MEKIYEVKELIKTCKTSKSVVYQLLNDGKLHGVKMGRQWKILESEVDRFLRGGGGEETKQVA